MKSRNNINVDAKLLIADAWQENDEALTRLNEATTILNKKADALLSLFAIIEHEGVQIGALPSKL